MVTTKRTAKDTVFSSLFKDPNYLLQLYKTLHPEDTEATVDMLQSTTIQNIITDRLYNDLGFVVRDKLMILVEAQSTWSVNIIVRAFLYLAQSYQDRFEQEKCNIYSSKPVELPEPELYVIYTGDREDHPETLTLSQEFFAGRKTALDVTVKVLYGDDRTSIVGQYVRFCKVLNEQTKLHGHSVESITETIRICKDEDVLKDYLISHEQETVSIMMALFNDEYIQEAYGYEREQKGLRQGLQRGMQQGESNMSSLFSVLLSAGKLEEAKQASADPIYRAQLMREYRIIPQ